MDAKIRRIPPSLFWESKVFTCFHRRLVKLVAGLGSTNHIILRSRSSFLTRWQSNRSWLATTFWRRQERTQKALGETVLTFIHIRRQHSDLPYAWKGISRNSSLVFCPSGCKFCTFDFIFIECLCYFCRRAATSSCAVLQWQRPLCRKHSRQRWYSVVARACGSYSRGIICRFCEVTSEAEAATVCSTLQFQTFQDFLSENFEAFQRTAKSKHCPPEQPTSRAREIQLHIGSLSKLSLVTCTHRNGGCRTIYEFW